MDRRSKRWLTRAITAVCVAVIALAACRSIGDEATAPIVRVACIGDSITFGTGIPDREAASYPARMAVLLGEGYRVMNYGVPGAGVQPPAGPDDRDRAYVNRPEHAHAVAFNANIVVCNLGVNDVGRFDADAFTEAYVKLVESYKAVATKPRVYLWRPLTPIFEGHRHFNDPNLTKINAAIGEVARRTGSATIDLHAPLADKPELLQKDGIHPNADGAAVIARIVADAIVADRPAGANAAK